VPHDESVDVQAINERTEPATIDEAAQPIEERPIPAQHGGLRPAPGRRDQDEPPRRLRRACGMLEDVARGVSGGDDGVGMRDHGRQKISQEGGIGVGRPIDLRACFIAESGPVDGQRRIAPTVLGARTQVTRCFLLAPEPHPARLAARFPGQWKNLGPSSITLHL
jgi:hypothetical protein